MTELSALLNTYTPAAPAVTNAGTDARIIAQDGGGTLGDGGDVIVQAGTATSGNGGSITLAPGTAAGSGNDGHVVCALSNYANDVAAYDGGVPLHGFYRTGNALHTRTAVPPFMPDLLGTLAAWFTAHDNSYMTVNSDGTGGAPADGGTVGRWLDRSGNSNHVSQTTAANRPMWRTGHGLNFRWDNANNQSDLRNTSVTAMPRQNSSGGMIVWLPGSHAVPLVDFGTTASGYAVHVKSGADSNFDSRVSVHTGLAFESSSIFLTSRRCVIGWRSNASNFVWYINGTELSRSALSAGSAMTSVFFGTFAGGTPKPIRIFEAAFYTHDIGAANIAYLNTYLRNNAGPASDAARTVFAWGDSLTMGVGSDTNKPWHDYVTNRSASTWYTWAADGKVIQANETQDAINAIKGSAESVVIVWMGTNDIIINLRTGVQVHGDVSTRCTTLRAAGNKVLVCTMPHFTTGSNVERQAFNTLLKANYTSYADGIVKLDEHTALDDATDTTYFCADQTHLKDAGYAVVGGLIQTAMAALP